MQSEFGSRFNIFLSVEQSFSYLLVPHSVHPIAWSLYSHSIPLLHVYLCFSIHLSCQLTCTHLLNIAANLPTPHTYYHTKEKKTNKKQMNHRQREWQAGQYDAGAIDQALVIHFLHLGGRRVREKNIFVCVGTCASVGACCVWVRELEHSKNKGKNWARFSAFLVIREVYQVPSVTFTTCYHGLGMAGEWRGRGWGGGDKAREGQSRRENKVWGKSGPHALNLNLELVRSERGGRGSSAQSGWKKEKPSWVTPISPRSETDGDKGDMVPFSKLTCEPISTSVSVLFLNWFSKGAKVCKFCFFPGLVKHHQICFNSWSVTAWEEKWKRDQIEKVLSSLKGALQDDSQAVTRWNTSVHMQHKNTFIPFGLEV